MDDDYDDFDDDDDFDRDFDDDGESDSDDAVDDNDVALDAFLDGQFDAEYNGMPYPSYEMSVDADKLTDAQKDLYETEYLAGYQDQQIQDELNGD